MSLSSLPAAQPDPRMTRRSLPVVTGLSARSNDQHENKPLPMHLAHAYKSFAIPLQWLTLPGTVFTPPPRLAAQGPGRQGSNCGVILGEQGTYAKPRYEPC